LYVLLCFLFHIYVLLQIRHLNRCLFKDVFPHRFAFFDKQEGQYFFSHLLNSFNKHAKIISYLA